MTIPTMDYEPHIARLKGGGLGIAPFSSNYRQFAVAMFHSFISMPDAQGHLKNYKAWGYETIFYSEMMEYLRTGDASKIPLKPLVITVDDGGLSNYDYLFAALKEFGMKATYFVVPTWINGDITAPANGGAFLEASPFTWAQAREMQASGNVELQAHTFKHGSMRALTGAGTFTADLSADGTGAGADFIATKTMIEANVPGANVLYNAAPYGVINETAIESLKAAGCKGNRITLTGKNFNNDYDGSGAYAYTVPGTDPFRIPITDGGSFNFLKRDNMLGQADAEGNRVENGKMLVTARGFTLPTGWLLFSKGLPGGKTGMCLRGLGLDSVNPAYHTNKILVGRWATFEIDWYVEALNVVGTGARIAIEVFENFTDTVPVRTITGTQGDTATTSWARKRWPFSGQGDFEWIRLRFETIAPAANTQVSYWDLSVKVMRNPLADGSQSPF